MSAFIEVRSVTFDDDRLWVHLADGRVLGVPLSWFVRLLQATPSQRANYTISPSGLHWEEVDEDLSIAGLLEGVIPRGGTPYQGRRS